MWKDQHFVSLSQKPVSWLCLLNGLLLPSNLNLVNKNFALQIQVSFYQFEI